jgi:hypothetical protein
VAGGAPDQDDAGRGRGLGALLRDVDGGLVDDSADVETIYAAVHGREISRRGEPGDRARARDLDYRVSKLRFTESPIFW